MPEPRFLIDTPLTSPGEYTLNRQESHHAAGVLRIREGDAVIVFDGLGHRAEAAVVASGRAAVRVRVDGIHFEERRPPELTIATALPKGKRWQSLVEKCTELGVDRIIPVLSERSVVKGEGDADKWRRWAVEAAKQSRRVWLPEVAEPLRLMDVLAMAEREEALVLTADRGGEPPSSFREELAGARSVVALVGPEGGYSDEELEYCRDRGARGICLSPFILRIETAAATVCAVVREISL